MVCVAVTATALSAHTVQAATGDPEPLSGVVYRDYNFDGVQTSGAFGIDEPGVQGVTVTAYCELDNDANPTTPGTDVTVVTDTTDGSGNYALTVKEGYDCRTEVTGWPAYLQPAENAAGNATTVQHTFVPDGGATNLAVGLINPADYYGTDPYVVANTPTFGDYTNTTYNGSESIVGVNWAAGGTSGTGANATHYDTDQVITHSTHAQTGTTFGAAWDRTTQTFYSAAFMKSNTGFGPTGPGGIYSTGISPTSGTTTTPSTSWLDVYALAGVNTCSDPHTAGNLTGSFFTTYPTFDETTFQATGTCSLGDIELSEDGTTLYVVNLATTPTSAGQILAIDVATRTLTAGSPWEIPISQLDCPAPLTDIHPGALAFNDGQLYAGVVCGADSTQSAADLRMYVYEVSPTGVFSEVLNEPLNYARGSSAASLVPADWRPWARTSADVPAMSTGITISDNNLYAQPWLTDIEFNGSVVLLGLRDRMADQAGPNALDASGSPNYFVNAGELLCVSRASGSWVLENNGVCGGNSDTAVFDNGGPGGREFFHDNGLFHSEGSQGGIAAITGFDDFAHVASNPHEVFNASTTVYGAIGFQYNNYSDGTPDRSVLTSNQNGDGVYLTEPYAKLGKGNGIGDIEALSQLAPVEIGSYVWFDDDADGIQDPAENPVVGATVRLYSSIGVLLATTTTSASGEYFFNSAGTDDMPNTVDDLFTPGDNVVVRIDNSADFTGAGVLNGYVPASDSQDLDDDADSDAVAGDSAGVGNGTFAEISTTTGVAGVNNHTYDFGFRTNSTSSLRIGNQLFFDANNDGVYDADELGIGNVTVELFADVDADGIFEPGDDDATSIATTITDSSGAYWFENLTAATYFVAIPSGATNTSVVIGSSTSIDLNTYFNSTSGGLINPSGSAQEPSDDNTDNNDDGRDGDNSAIPANYITMSAAIALTSGSEPTSETAPGGTTGDDEVEANAQTGSVMPSDNDSNLTIDFGFYLPTDNPANVSAELSQTGEQARVLVAVGAIVMLGAAVLAIRHTRT